jgi:hypothetical protein
MERIMNARTIVAASLGVIVMSTAAYANHSMPPIHHPNRHTSRDDLINSCVALPLQYANTATPLHTATTDQLRDQGATLCRGGARMVGVEKLGQALDGIGVRPNLD